MNHPGLENKKKSMVRKEKNSPEETPNQWSNHMNTTQTIEARLIRNGLKELFSFGKLLHVDWVVHIE